MPTFDTPEPILATIELAAGDVRIIASDRTDTVVEVRPSDPSNDVDVQVAEQTRVEYANGRLSVRAPRSRRTWFWRGGSIDVEVQLPTDSRVDASAAAGFRCQGRLGEARLTTGYGDVWLEQTGRLQLNTGSGDITVARAVGPADITSASGAIRVGGIDGTAVVKTANGDIAIGEATGDLRLSTANGDITVDRALASVVAKTASGSIRIGEVVRGAVVLETAYGGLELRVREGTAAWLDVSSQYGSVQVSLDASDGPGPSDETVEVRARTGYGDLVVGRS
jgi:Putative adhesin